MEKKAGQALHEDEEPEGEEDYTYLTVDDQEAEDGEEVVYTLDDGEEEQGEELSENNDRSGNDLRVSEGDRPELKEHKQTVGQPVENQLKQSDNIVKEGNHTAAEGKNVLLSKSDDRCP
jgi:hypothetical protein